MGNKYVLSLIAAALSFGLCYFWLTKEEQENEKFDHSFKKAGIPDQMEDKDIANFENAKMVSEGSQFGVQYFNKLSNAKKAELNTEK